MLVVPQGSRLQHGSVLVGTDFGAASEAALRWSERLERGNIARSIGHVAHRREMEEARARLEARAASAFLDFHLAVGTPVEGLLELAHRAGADALVLGVRRRRAVLEAFAGSTARGLLRRARMPVWLVPIPGS